MRRSSSRAHERDGLVIRVARGNRDEGGAIGLWQSIGFAVWAAIREATGGVDPDAYPNGDEQAALAMLPVDLRDTCARGPLREYETESGTTTITPLASLSCDLPAGAGADQLEVRLLPHSTQFSPEIIIGAEARARGIEPGDCATANQAHGRWSIGEEEVGAVVCYRPSNGSANVSWTRTEHDLYLWALRDDGDQAALWDWFDRQRAVHRPMIEFVP